VPNENRYELIFKRLNKMEIKEAIQVLKDHNEWRRGEDETLQMTDPKKLGIAIDTVVNEFENLFISGVVFNEAKKYKETLENLQQDEKGKYYFGKAKESEMELCNHVGSVTRDGRGEYCKKCGKIW
jgi:hypothetical protein